MADQKNTDSHNTDNYNRGGYIAFLFSMAFSLAFFVYVSFIHPGVDLGEIPEGRKKMQAEQIMAEGSAQGDEGQEGVDVASIEEPWVSSEALVQHGEKVYQNNCAVCHGAGGQGNGPAGANLNPAPRNLVEGDWQEGGSAIGLYKTLQNGIEGGSMASFSHLPKVDRWAMVHYIRSITENKVPTDKDKLKKFAQSAE